MHMTKIVCPECGVAPHFVEQLFNCQSHPTQLTVQDLWDNPAVVADFLNLTIRDELLGYHNNKQNCAVNGRMCLKVSGTRRLHAM